jgi:selenocysteine lyase/cysteine desulfurase
MYDYPKDVIQLEAGQFGAMARPVHRAYEGYLNRINTETTLYTRGSMNGDLAKVRAQAAAMLGVDIDEIAWTRGGTESMMTLIGGYNRLKPGDAVMYADLDYDSMQTGMDGMARMRGLRVARFNLPEPATKQSLIDAYAAALKANPDVRLLLVTHLSHRTGLVPPVKEITALARARGVDVLLDCGHALGQVDFRLRDLGVDFAGLNLHKWIGSPVGVGLVYIRKDRIADIDVNLAEPPSPRIDARVHTGTVNYGAVLAVPDAIAFHDSIGLTNKAYRLRYLRDRWAEAVRANPAVEVLTPDDPDLHAGITSFRFRGQGSAAQVLALKKTLFDRYRIFTVERLGPAKGACIRVSPSFVNTPADCDALTRAITELARG